MEIPFPNFGNGNETLLFPGMGTGMASQNWVKICHNPSGCKENPRQPQYIALPGQLNCRSTMETPAPGEGDVLWLTEFFFAGAGAPGGKEIPL